MDSERVSLGRVLKPARREVIVTPDETYRTAGIYSFGKGLFEREPVRGTDTSYKTLFRLEENDFVISRLNGWEGAVDVVEKQMAGCHVSNEYPAFEIDTAQAVPNYLRWIAKWPTFWDRLVPRGSMVRRKRVQVEQLLELAIPLPALDVQLSIAERLNRVAAGVEIVVDRHAAASELQRALAVSLCTRPDVAEAAKVSAGWEQVELAKVLQQAKNRVRVDPGTAYPNLGILSFGRGVFEKPMIEGGSTSATVLNQVGAGQFIYSRLFAFEGAYAYVPAEFDGYYVSNEFPTFDPDPARLDARWLATYLRSPERWAELAGSSKGLGVRRQRIPAEAVLAHELWLPPINQQRTMVHDLDRLDAAAAARMRADERARSLIPAVLNRTFEPVS